MGKIIDKAFVLRRVRYGERACLLDLYTKHYGRITVGSNLSSKSGKSALNNPFTLAELEINLRRDRYYLDKGLIISDFRGLQDNLERLTAADLVAEIILDNVREGLSDSDIYELIAYTLYNLSTSDQVSKILSVAILRLAVELGFEPWLDDCLVCHDQVEGEVEFSLGRGGLVCSKPACHSLVYGTQTFRLSPDLRRLISLICNLTYGQIFNLQIDSNNLMILNNFVEQYTENIFEKNYQIRSKLNKLERFTLAAQESLRQRREAKDDL